MAKPFPHPFPHPYRSSEPTIGGYVKSDISGAVYRVLAEDGERLWLKRTDADGYYITLSKDRVSPCAAPQPRATVTITHPDGRVTTVEGELGHMESEFGGASRTRVVRVEVFPRDDS